MGVAHEGGHHASMSNTNFDAAQVGSALADAVAAVGGAVVHVSAGGRLASGVVFAASERRIVTTSRLFHGERDQAVSVRFGDGTSRAARLVGADEATELALIELDPGDGPPLPEVRWADGARVGLFVAPVARTESGLRTTLGVVTRVGPAWVTARGGTVDRYIDVDGTLPPGFSGGPLIDFSGAVLGVNTRGLVPGGVTLPSATVRRVIGLLASGGSTAPGHLGVAIQAVELPEALRVDPSAARGLLVTGVGQGSAAERAAIQVGDVIVAIDGQATTDHAHLLAALAGKVGKPVTVRVARHGQAIDLSATPGARAERRHHGPHGPQGQHGPHGHHGTHGQGRGRRGFWGCR